MPDYQKGKIYKLWSPQGNEIYIGSTINPLAKRLNQHKNHNNNCNSKYLFENYDNVKIELIQEYPCNNKMELVKKEGEHIRSNECLNKVVPGRTLKEWREDNKERNTEYFKEWCENNKDRYKECQKVWYENNKQKILEIHSKKFECDCGSVISTNNKSEHFKSKKHIAFMNSRQVLELPE
jgi:hypothetical protein